MYEFVLERRLQYNLTAVEGPVLVSCWEVEYELWRVRAWLGACLSMYTLAYHPSQATHKTLHMHVITCCYL